MEQVSGKVSWHLPFVYFSWNFALHKSILNGKIEEKEADIYRSSNFFLQKEYIGKYFSNSSESKPTFTVRLPFLNEKFALI